jgi:perosamine synthetase
MEPIQHSCPWITDEDIVAVAAVLKSSMIGQGEQVRSIEQRLSAWLHASDAVEVGSGGAAIVLALRGLKVGLGDEVILPTYVCRSVLEAIIAVGAKPVLCDVGPDWVMTVADAARVITDQTRAIVIPHMYGIFADVESFRPLGLAIVEDCAQALDAEWARAIKGDVATLSFHPTKCLTSGEGGMAVAVDAELVARMRTFRDGGYGYADRVFSPLSDLAASLVLSHLDRYEQGLARRREIAANYRKAIETCCPSATNHITQEQSMFFRFPLHLQGGLVACQDAFTALGVQVKKGVDELLNRHIGQSDSAFPCAVAHYDTTISLPIYPSLNRAQESRCLKAITQVLPRFQLTII